MHESRKLKFSDICRTGAAVNCLKGGQSLRGVAKSAGKPESSVRGWVKKAGFSKKGGQWRHASESRAQRIVSTMLEDEPPFSPRVAAPSTSKIMNKLGHGFGTSYHGTPEDWAEWQRLNAKGMPVMGPEAAPKETLKNKYGGMPPHPPYQGQ